jgi:hypothetical protein
MDTSDLITSDPTCPGRAAPGTRPAPGWCPCASSHDLRKRFVLYKKLVSVAAAAAVVVVAFVPGTAQALIGGTPVQQNHKFIASLVFKKEAIQEKKDKVNCALTLVSQLWAIVPGSLCHQVRGGQIPL